MKKLVTILLVVSGLSWAYTRYGYLITSFQNFPKKSDVDTSPVTISKESNDDSSLSFLHLQPGYQISYFAKDVPGARSLAVGDSGVVYVGTRDPGVVYALVDNNQDGVADNRFVVASKLNSPNGVVYHEGTLYIAEIGRVIKFENIDDNYMNNPSYSVVYDDLPKDTHHGWRYMAIGPDDKLYLGIGAPCNTCQVEDPYGSIARMNLDGTGFEIVARGIRNTVGFDWNPEDQSLWFTENGRDMLGEDSPRDELNQLRTEGDHFGFPYCHDGTILDPKFGTGKSCTDYESPSLSLSPHAAALGMKFIGDRILIAEHGSWNRKVPTGYRVMSVDVANGVVSNYQVFIDGWLGEDGKAKGRPVDILQLRDGSILISDDFSGSVYRVTNQVQ